LITNQAEREEKKRKEKKRDPWTEQFVNYERKNKNMSKKKKKKSKTQDTIYT